MAITFLCGWVALTVPAAAAAPKAQTFRRQATASVEETSIPDGSEPDHVLLEQVFHISEQTNAEGSQSTLEVTAWKSGKRRYDTKLWSFTDEANASEMWSAEKNPIPANIGGFRVELSFATLDDKKELVVVPVLKDDFDLEHATVPSTLKLVRVR